MLITSLTNDSVKEIVKLRDKKYRDLTSTFIVEGFHLVEEAYKNKLLLKLLKLESSSSSFDVETVSVTESIMKKISELNTVSDYIGICRYKDVMEEYGDNVIVLNGVQDPGNLGTIIRSAIAFNISTIVVDNNTVDVYNSKVIRATQGMIFNINIIKKDLYSFINDMKKKGYIICSTNTDGDVLLKDINKSEKHVIIMGNEGTGIEKELEKACDCSIRIPINSNCESINVGVATSIVLYELSR